ncbi:MAG: hypothetical protein GX434_05030 [Peptococcaceae bacterium]|nr:hypothetical protein [Peptococcaceae bacterium]
MNNMDKILKILEDNGILFTSDLKRLNIPRTYLSKLEKQGEIERVSRGVYISKNMIDDEIYYVQLKFPNIIYSHETALFMHGLSDRTPIKYSITVPSTYKVPKNIKEKYKVFYIRPELHNVGIMLAKNSFGHDVKIYNVERTICDIIRSRSKMDLQIFYDALKRYTKSKTLDYLTLNEYAKELKVDKILRKYLEVLL